MSESFRAPVFYTSTSYAPSLTVFVNGATLSLALFIGISLLIGYGGRRWTFLIGSHEPSHSHLLAAASSAAPASLSAEIRVKPEPGPDPRDKVAAAYFELMPVLRALDANRDLVISPWEIFTAPAALRGLDKNRDGILSAEESGAHFLNEAEQDPELLKQHRRLFMRSHPVLAALDADRDGEISAGEIKNAAAALETLDKNGDGQLTADEVIPDPLVRVVVSVMFELDKNNDGKVSADERRAESARPFRKLLDAADLDKDGIVTEEEVTNEIWRRADLNQDGVVTADELRYARKSGAFGPIPGANGPSRKSP